MTLFIYLYLSFYNMSHTDGAMDISWSSPLITIIFSFLVHSLSTCKDSTHLNVNVMSFTNLKKKSTATSNRIKTCGWNSSRVKEWPPSCWSRQIVFNLNFFFAFACRFAWSHETKQTNINTDSTQTMQITNKLRDFVVVVLNQKKTSYRVKKNRHSAGISKRINAIAPCSNNKPIQYNYANHSAKAQ